jgi:hypothetical protein
MDEAAVKKSKSGRERAWNDSWMDYALDNEPLRFWLRKAETPGFFYCKLCKGSYSHQNCGLNQVSLM